MIRIGFVQPSSDYLYDPFRGDPHTHFYILTILEDRLGDKIEVHLIDLRGIKKEFALYHIPECDIYLHSVYTLDYAEQISIVKNLRLKYPKAIHIAGGPHIISFLEENLKIFDALIIGEGEEIIVQAINDFIDGSLKIKYQQEGIIDINLYPYSQRKYLPKNSIARSNLLTLKNKPGSENKLATTAIFSRGCPYRCSFCALNFARETSPGIRYRNPNIIEQEIEYLKREYGIDGLSLLDEIGIPLNEQAATIYLETIARTGIIWRGQCRVDGINHKLAKLARESGCIAMGLGVESINQLSLNLITKKIDINQAKETIQILQSNDIEARLYMIIGLPGEPEDIIEKTWSFIVETSPSIVYLSLFTVRPGTEVYTHPEKFGIKTIKTDWQKTMHMYSRFGDEQPTLTFEYESETLWGRGMSPEKIVANYLELQKRLKEYNLCSL